MNTKIPPKLMSLNIPSEFSKLANVVTLCDLRPNEKILFEHACKLVLMKLQSDNVTPPDIVTNIIFADSEDITLEFSASQMGGCFIGIFYPVHRWRSSGFTDQQIITCMTEEMCHVFWCIRDETQVDYKVLDVLRQGFPQLTLESLYPYTRNR